MPTADRFFELGFLSNITETEEKKKMKCKLHLRSLLTVAAVLAATLLRAAGTETCVVVEQVDGTKTEYLLADDPRVSYDGSAVRLVSTAAQVELPVESVARVYLAERTQASLPALAAGSGTLRVQLVAGGLELSGLEPGSTGSVCSLDGRQVAGGRASAGGSLQLPLTNVPGGVVVVRASNKSFKIILK